jgi:hypothetical protein
MHWSLLWPRLAHSFKQVWRSVVIVMAAAASASPLGAGLRFRQAHRSFRSKSKARRQGYSQNRQHKAHEGISLLRSYSLRKECPLYPRMCCKTILTAKTSNIDSRTNANAQQHSIDSALHRTGTRTVQELMALSTSATCLGRLPGRRRQVRNHGHRTSDIAVHRPYLCQLHHHHCSLDKSSLCPSASDIHWCPT